MYASLVVFALSGYFVQAGFVPDSLHWLRDYASASELGRRESKPLAVFFGSGENGWERVSKDGGFAPEIRQMLCSAYVCLYVDISEEEGKFLASSFHVTEQLGLVLSDRSGEVQAFRHEGELANAELERFLRKYADPQRVPVTTESKASEQIRYYGPSVTNSFPVSNVGVAQNC